MARLDISQLPAVPAHYRIDRLEPDPDGKLMFETRSASRAEDAKRSRWLRSACASSQPENSAAIELANRLSGPTGGCTGSLASSRYMRQLRIKIIGNLWRLVGKEGWRVEELRVFTALPKGWEFTPDTLDQADPNKLLERFRSQLRRNGAVSADGSLIAGIHGEFEPEARVYRLHIHGLATGQMTGVLDSLRTLPAYRPRPLVAYPIRMGRKPLEDLPYPLGYPFKSYWPSRWIGAVDDGATTRQRGHHRIPEPYHSQVLLWLDRWSAADMVLLMNLRVGHDGFVVTPFQNVHQSEGN